MHASSVAATTNNERSVVSTAITMLGNARRVEVPPYGQRSSYHPRTDEDFGDGGAFPEIHIQQFPLGMGRKKVC